jgi:hypothetical protein
MPMVSIMPSRVERTVQQTLPVVSRGLSQKHLLTQDVGRVKGLVFLVS